MYAPPVRYGRVTGLWFMLIAILTLGGCGTTLDRADVSDDLVRREAERQKNMARALERERRNRLYRVARQLQPGLRLLCRELGEPGRQCRYPVELVNDDTLNAAADGHVVYIQSGMIRFVESDDELAFVIGHEIAHNLLDHIGKRKANAAVGLVVDILAAGAGIDTNGAFSKAGAMAFSQEFEGEADYAGLYLVALGGYDITKAPNFWRRMGVEHPDAISKRFNATHPSTPERFVAMDAAVVEILDKQARGEPLVPNRTKRDVAESDSKASHDRPVSSDPIAYPTRPAKTLMSAESTVTEVGEWQYSVEDIAMQRHCFGAGGVRPGAKLVHKAPAVEHYEVACSNGTVLRVACEYQVCSVQE